MEGEVKRLATIARRAIVMMEQRHVVATPDNYTVWYRYCTGEDEALKRSIDILISNNQDFTSEICADLFQRFFGARKETEQVRLVTRQIETVVGRALGSLADAGQEARRYGETLDASAISLSRESEVDRAREILRQVMSETRSMIDRTDALERQLSKSTEEIGQLQKQVEVASREALTDALTGIGNRKHFDQRLKFFMQDAMEQGTELCLLIMDIDHFKKFNDTFGHQFGDLVLRLVAKRLVDGIKGADQAARYGGEEFAILLPNTRLEDARVVADKLRESIAAKALVKKDTKENLGVVTISIGVACYRLGEPPYVLIERADAALYRAKQTGRNRVVLETELDDARPKKSGS